MRVRCGSWSALCRWSFRWHQCPVILFRLLRLQLDLVRRLVPLVALREAFALQSAASGEACSGSAPGSLWSSFDAGTGSGCSADQAASPGELPLRQPLSAPAANADSAVVRHVSVLCCGPYLVTLFVSGADEVLDSTDSP
jgi:hypothetical protein